MKSIAQRIALFVGVSLSALALASCAGAGGGGVSSSALPMTAAAPVAVRNNTQPHAVAPHIVIKEIAIPKSPGPAMGGIAVTADSSVYVSLYGGANTPLDIGARYANGSFTTLVLDPFFGGPPVGPVAATQNAAAHFATQISVNFCFGSQSPQCDGIASYGPTVSTESFGPVGGAGTISDMAGDSNGNLWYAQNPYYGVSDMAIVAKVPEDILNSPACCATLPDQTIVSLSYGDILSTGALAAAPNGDAWVATSGPSIYHISAAGAIVHIYALPRGTNVGGIAVTPDDNVWFTDSGHNAIRRLSRYGKFSRYAIPTPASGVDRITVGPDGALWFTEKSAEKIGRITKKGHIHEYAVPTSNAQPTGISSLGTGCNPSVIWFVEQGADKIAEITLK